MLDLGPPRARGDHLVDRVRAHRRADRLPKKVDQQEIRLCCPRHCTPLERVAVDSLHHQKVAAPPAVGGTWPTPRSACPGAPQADTPAVSRSANASRPVDAHPSAATRPVHRGAQPGPRHSSTINLVARRPAGPQQRHDLGFAGPVHYHLRLVQPVPRPQPPGQPMILTVGLRRNVTFVGQLVDQTTSARPVPARPPPRVRRIPAPRSARR